MGRERVSGTAGGADRRRKAAKRAPGLAVVERDGFWHITGTLRAAGRSRRLRQSVGLRATPENRDAAEAERLRLERAFRDTVVHGKQPSVPLAVAADRYLQARPELGDGERRVIREITLQFGYDVLAEISDEAWHRFATARHAGNARATMERWLNSVVAFLNWCARKPRRWLQSLPSFERDQKARKPKHRRARRVAELTPDLILFLARHASPHLKGQIAAMWSTGARASSVLYGCRLCDYIAAPGREQITYHDTKNGEPVVAALHADAAALMRDYLDWRGNLQAREAPLFVRPNGKPYSTKGKGKFGGQTKTAFRGMKRRAMATLAANAVRQARQALQAGDKDAAAAAIADARQARSLIRQITPHWFRHTLATKMMSAGGDLRSTMEQGGWLSAESVMGYTHDVPEHRREIVARLATPLTRAADTDKNRA